jgi:hypothetical protein
LPVFEAIGWDCETMLTGIRAAARHDLKPFSAKEAFLSVAAGTSLGFTAMCLLVKADWAEWVHTLGFPSWNDSNSPCPLCFTDKESMHKLPGFCSRRMPKQAKTSLHYDAACSACEIRTVLAPGEVIRVRARLEFERRQGQSKGRVLQEDLPELGLCKGDRVVPTPEFPDIGSLSPEEAPREVKWWRQSCETITKFRNPLFHPRTGITLLSLALDWLHILSLGVFQVILGHLLQRLLRRNAFRVRGTSTNLMELGLSVLKGHLGVWYTEQAKAGKQYTHLEDLSVSSLGSESDPGLSLPGAATNGVLAFAHDVLLPRFGDVLEAARPHFVAAVSSCVRIREAIREHERVMPDDVIERFCSDVALHISSLEKLGIPMMPKHHLLLEMGARL